MKLIRWIVHQLLQLFPHCALSVSLTFLKVYQILLLKIHIFLKYVAKLVLLQVTSQFKKFLWFISERSKFFSPLMQSHFSKHFQNRCVTSMRDFFQQVRRSSGEVHKVQSKTLSIFSRWIMSEYIFFQLEAPQHIRALLPWELQPQIRQQQRPHQRRRMSPVNYCITWYKFLKNCPKLKGDKIYIWNFIVLSILRLIFSNDQNRCTYLCRKKFKKKFVCFQTIVSNKLNDSKRNAYRESLYIYIWWVCVDDFGDSVLKQGFLSIGLATEDEIDTVNCASVYCSVSPIVHYQCRWLFWKFTKYCSWRYIFFWNMLRSLCCSK